MSFISSNFHFDCTFHALRHVSCKDLARLCYHVRCKLRKQPLRRYCTPVTREMVRSDADRVRGLGCLSRSLVYVFSPLSVDFPRPPLDDNVPPSRPKMMMSQPENHDHQFLFQQVSGPNWGAFGPSCMSWMDLHAWGTLPNVGGVAVNPAIHHYVS